MKWKDALHDYQLFLRIEKGLAKNSIDSYARDVKKLIRYLEELELVLSPISINQDEIQQFIYTVSKSINPRSQSRLISGLRNFFDYLVFEDYRKDNPTDLIESPKTGRKLPDTLSVEDIDGVIELRKTIE